MGWVCSAVKKERGERRKGGMTDFFIFLKDFVGLLLVRFWVEVCVINSEHATDILAKVAL